MRLSWTTGLPVLVICIVALTAAAALFSHSPDGEGLPQQSTGAGSPPALDTGKNISGLPPDAAIMACSGKAAGNPCRFTDRDTLTDGLCDDRPGVLACAPEREQKGGQAPGSGSGPQKRTPSQGLAPAVTTLQGGGTSRAGTGSFSLASDAVTDGGTLPAEYSCDGSGATPGLVWSGAPAGTKEYALMMTTMPVDGSVRWNWVLYHIPGTTSALARNSSGIGTPGTGSHGTVMMYDPPCPQGPGAKTYTITLYALSAQPVLPATADQVTGPVLTEAISSITLGKASFNVSFTRQ